jgi:S-adenosylmethionine:tRNA ribosyltransferase-isomerase
MTIIRPCTPKSLAAPPLRPLAFHFTPELFDQFKGMGITVVDITLNIGLGTFRPVKVQDTKDHVMHSETFDVSKEAADTLNKAKAEGIAASSRLARLRSALLRPRWPKKANSIPRKTRRPRFSFSRALFIKPSIALITNFHLPKSTLVMLVSAFMGRKWTLHCYEEAIKNKYRFFSFGDAMFIYGKYDYSHNLED